MCSMHAIEGAPPCGALRKRQNRDVGASLGSLRRRDTQGDEQCSAGGSTCVVPWLAACGSFRANPPTCAMCGLCEGHAFVRAGEGAMVPSPWGSVVLRRRVR
eukprot:1940349-Prymnesium_polylepis.1